jgi:hypothetical protein
MSARLQAGEPGTQRETGNAKLLGRLVWSAASAQKLRTFTAGDRKSRRAYVLPDASELPPSCRFCPQSVHKPKKAVFLDLDLSRKVAGEMPESGVANLLPARKFGLVSALPPRQSCGVRFYLLRGSFCWSIRAEEDSRFAFP